MQQTHQRIRFTRTLSTLRQLFRKGHEYELPRDEAEKYCAVGLAQVAKPAKPKNASRE